MVDQEATVADEIHGQVLGRQGFPGWRDVHVGLWLNSKRAVGVHILRKLMHYYQQDAVNSLRRCRLSMQCTGSVADEAYLNHKRDQDLARARERERERS